MKKIFAVAIIVGMALAACGKKAAPVAPAGDGSAAGSGETGSAAGSDAPADPAGDPPADPAGGGSAM